MHTNFKPTESQKVATRIYPQHLIIIVLCGISFRSTSVEINIVLNNASTDSFAPDDDYGHDK